MTPILFLDFDGVLNSARHMNSLVRVPGEPPMAAPAHVAVLNQVLRQSDAHIVVSSAWRYGRSNAALHRLLTGSGVVGRVVGRTEIHDVRPGTLWEGEPARGIQIQNWITEHAHDGPFAIVDDDADMVHLTPWLVRTTFDLGLCEEHVAPLVKLLRTPPGEVDAGWMEPT